MSDRGWIEPIVERVVGQVLESHANQLRTEIVRRVMEEIAAQPSAAPAASTPSSSAADLARAVSEIQVGSSQKEILRGLLESSSPYASRVALFVVKGSHASGWQSRGFANGEAIKDFSLDSNVPAVARAISERVGSAVAGGEFDPRFLEQFGVPNGDARLLPLMLKEKVAALVYADGGTDGGAFDAGSLEVLVLATSAWLEINSLRKQAQKEPSASSNETHSQVPAAAPAFNDPFAAHAPAYAMAAAASADSHSSVAISEPAQALGQSDSGVVAEAQSAVAEIESAAVAAPTFAVEESSPAGHAVTHHEAQSAPETPAAPTISAEDQETHRKAQRFARLLVDEIKLYNQAKVSEGRKKKDLYDRLKDTIEKSRSTYQKRYGNTVAGSGNYFQHELIRSLAEDDLTIMGPNFRL